MNKHLNSEKDRQDGEGRGCRCIGCFVIIGILLALSGNWWAWVPLVLAAMIYSLLNPVKEDKAEKQSNREWWRLD